MSDKYLISIDLDGTLLKDDKSISENTAEILKTLQNLGHLIVLTTGRPYRGVKNYHNLLGLNAPIICYNGAAIFDHNDNLLYEKTLEYNSCKELCNEIVPYYADLALLETHDEIFTNKYDKFLFSFYNDYKMNVHYGEINEILNKNTYTLIFRIHNSINKIKTIIKDFVDSKENFEVRFWNKEAYCELYHSGVSKASAVKYLAQLYNIDIKNIVAIGDSDNDVELLSEFENTFVMLNGMDSLKKIAKFTTKYDNNHDGVGIALKEFFNL